MRKGKNKLSSRVFSIITSFMLLLTSTLLLLQSNDAILQADAISVDYPAELVHISTYDNSNNLNISETTDNAALKLSSADGTHNENWRFDYVGNDSVGSYFKLVNQGSGRLLTPLHYKATANTSCVIYGSESDKTQHWYITAVSNDAGGCGLYYKITNYVDHNLALTNSNGSLTLTEYSGANNQKWLFNPAGLQGFGGYGKDLNGATKSATIGGLLGETVEVSTFDELKAACSDSTPRTIIIKENISKTGTYTVDANGRYQFKDARIYLYPNKTIIGSYGANSLYNVFFCTYPKDGYGRGDNIIIKNITISHDPDLNNDNVWDFADGYNYWIDHCTFVGHNDVNTASTGQVDWDKFLCFYWDADYITISDCSFGMHEYGLLLGYPSDTDSDLANYNNLPRVTLAENHFNQTLTRAPGLVRYGYYHSLNNFVENFNLGYTIHTAAKLYTENCYYDGGAYKGSVVNDDYTSNGSSISDLSKAQCAYTDSGSVAVNCYNSNNLKNVKSKACSWRPSSNYAYKAFSAADAKTYCASYSGAQSSALNMNYATFQKPGVPSAGYVQVPNNDPAYIAANFTEGSAYMIKNVNSGLYMEVQDGKAANGANVQQWGAEASTAHNTWRFFSAGDGYYYIVSALDDGASYVLDIAGAKSDNGTNVGLYQYKASDNQKFMLTENSDGSYKIRTKVSGEASAIEAKDASATSGANIQEWEINGANCQNWMLEPVSNPGVVMDTSVVYSFQNVNSTLVMDVYDGTMKDNTNVQQWGANDCDSQKWVLKSFGSGNYYYIRSLQDPSYVLCAESTVNGGNIDIVTYSTKNSAMLFKFTKNLDGSYSIMTRASMDTCLVEVADASKSSGANVRQWEPNANDCQKWNVVTETTTTATAQTTTTTAVTADTITETTKSTATTTTMTNPIVKGDVNFDGKISIADAVVLQKYLLACTSFTKEQFEIADLMEDGSVNGFDLGILRQMLLH